MTHVVFRERILINSMLHLTFSMVPNIVFAPKTMQNGHLTLYLHLTLCRMQNTDRGRRTQTEDAEHRQRTQNTDTATFRT